MKEFVRVLKFTFFSISAGLIEMGSFALLNEFTHFPYWPCYLIALCLSVLWNFTLNRKFTFQSAANVPVAMAKVAAYYAVFTPLSTLLGQLSGRQSGVERIPGNNCEYAAEFLHGVSLSAVFRLRQVPGQCEAGVTARRESNVTQTE